MVALTTVPAVVVVAVKEVVAVIVHIVVVAVVVAVKAFVQAVLVVQAVEGYVVQAVQESVRVVNILVVGSYFRLNNYIFFVYA